jgi:hypothetical protein
VAGPLVDHNRYDADPTGTFFNRVQTVEVGTFRLTETVHFPKSCLHCEDPPCVQLVVFFGTWGLIATLLALVTRLAVMARNRVLREGRGRKIYYQAVS